jgi:GNAT superfamily N-acetyltransferase
MEITIKEVNSANELKAFIAFPEELYKGCDNWVNSLWADEYNTLKKEKNPAFEFCEAWYFLALAGNKVAGRVAAIINHHANRDWNQKYMRFGWLDFIDDQTVSKALMDKVETLAREKGMEAVNGPFGFTDMDKEGMLTEGFENMGSMTTLYNYPYYPKHLEKLGYLKDADWHQNEFEVPESVPPKLKQYAEIVTRRYGVKVLHPKSRKSLTKYGVQLFEALNRAFVPLYGFTPLTQAQIRMYVKQYLPMVNFDMICLVLDKDDKVVAFAITMPNLSWSLKKSGGKLFPFGFIFFLKALKRYDLVDMYMIGVVPEYQNKGLNAVIFNHLHTNYIKLGVKKVIANPQLENNIAVQNIFDYYQGKPYMTRRCYIKILNT